MSQVDVTVDGAVPAMQQPSDMTCWATAATILYSWKNQSATDIPTALATASPNYVKQFQDNQGLSGDDKPAFLQAMGFTAEPPEDFSVDGWAQLLENHGPLWVTTNEGTAQQFSVHARILKGISGDEQPDSTYMQIIDPGTGTEYSETVSNFMDKFDDIARQELGDGVEFRPQVVHY